MNNTIITKNDFLEAVKIYIYECDDIGINTYIRHTIDTYFHKNKAPFLKSLCTLLSDLHISFTIEGDTIIQLTIIEYKLELYIDIIEDCLLTTDCAIEFDD